VRITYNTPDPRARSVIDFLKPRAERIGFCLKTDYFLGLKP